MVSSPGQMFKIGAANGQDSVISFGDLSSTTQFDVVALSVDAAQDIVVGRTVFQHDYVQNKSYNVSLSVCCRSSGSQNGNKKVYLTTTVNLRVSNNAFASVGSPTIRSLPRVMLSSGPNPCVFQIPATSAWGVQGRSNLLWRAAPSNFDLMGYSLPAAAYGVAVNASTGLVSVSTSCTAYQSCNDVNFVLMVSDGASVSSVDLTLFFNTAPGARASSDLGLTLVAPPLPHPLASQASSIVGGLPPVTVFVGYKTQVSFVGSNLPGTSLYFEFSAMPPGASLGPMVGQQQNLMWVPTDASVGEEYVCVSAVQLDSARSMAVAPCAPSCPLLQRSAPLCFNFNVIRTAPASFVQPTLSETTVLINQQFQVLHTTPYPPCFYPPAGQHGRCVGLRRGDAEKKGRERVRAED